MTDAELYQYDARGYLLLQDLMQSSQLEAIDALYDRRLGDAEALRTQAGNDNHVMLEDILNQEIDALRPLVALPGLLPYIDEMIEAPRLKSTWASFMWPKGGVAFHGNHTPPNTCNHYYFNGRILHNLLQVFIAVRDIPRDGGALELLPGSHKANFKVPGHETVTGMLDTIEMRAGSILIFAHDMYHGSSNMSDVMRRVLIFTYCPGVIANSFGGDGLYDTLHSSAPEKSWEKYLLRRPNGYKEMYPYPAGRLYGDG